MTANDFVRNVYRGENIDECEEHLRSFCKAKLQDLIPEHFKLTKKYTEIAESHKNLFEDCKDAKDCENADDEVDEDSEDINDKDGKDIKERFGRNRKKKGEPVDEDDESDDSDDSEDDEGSDEPKDEDE